jgi:hypothetical protein
MGILDIGNHDPDRFGLLASQTAGNPVWPVGQFGDSRMYPIAIRI